MERDTTKYWLPFAIFAIALVVWAGLFALGAYLEWGADQPRHDLRKPLIIFGSMAVFLSLWGVALWQRARRKQ
jgi:membrane protein DedA with SNARE-associated domain